jgi:hypothetical protein
MVKYWDFHNFSLPQDVLKCKWQGHSVTHQKDDE